MAKADASYIPTIGIECHVQLKSRTKLFSGAGNDARGAEPNSLISHICVGLPGALPVLNEGALRLAARAAYALGTVPQKSSHFDRKHYFYPDLPKGYQITQYSEPIIVDGQVEITVDGQKKTVGITRAHLEEDAGKNTHPEGVDYSLVDLNRAGTPLLEIVSQPDINSPQEAKAFARELYLLMKYSQVSDVDLYHGNMRFDVNVSLSAGSALGKRTEIKNLNSFRSVEAAVEYEIKRQTEVLQSGGNVVQETRGWDEAKQKTVSQRGKEEAEDYRYFPEPDVPPIKLSAAWLAEVQSALPVLPPAIRLSLRELDLDPQVIEDILDRAAIVPLITQVIDKAAPEHARRIAFWLLGTQIAEDKADGLQKLDIDRLIDLSNMVAAGQLSSTAAKTVFAQMISSDRAPADIAEELSLFQESDDAQIAKIVDQVINNNPKVVEDIKNGELKAVGFLVGQVMAASQGQANPALAQAIIKKRLGIDDGQA